MATTQSTILILDEFSINTIKLQPQNSNLIMKIENCFDEKTVKSLYYLSAIYDKVFIIKPSCCWNGESTKYLVGKNKNKLDQELFSHNKTLDYIKDIKLTNFFLSKIAEINCIYVQSQIETLLSIINKPIHILVKMYQQKCIHWFIKHQLEHTFFIDLEEKQL